VYQLIDLCIEDLDKVVQAYVGRMAKLEEQLHQRGAEVEGHWVSEVQSARLQLQVVERYLRCHQSMLRRVCDDPDLSDGLAGYLKDAQEHLEEAQADAGHTIAKCKNVTEQHGHLVDRAEARARQRAEDLDRVQQDRAARGSERLNNILFVLTVATTIFAPVQFMAGVYGMNFVGPDGKPTIPELLIPEGYLYFWVVVVFYLAVASLVACLLFKYLKRVQAREEMNVSAAKSEYQIARSNSLRSFSEHEDSLCGGSAQRLTSLRNVRGSTIMSVDSARGVRFNDDYQPLREQA